MILPVLTLALLLSSGDLDNSSLLCGDGPTYFPRGDHWPATPPLDSNPILFRQYTGGSADINDGSDLIAVQEAFATWMNQSCSGEWPNILVLDANHHSGMPNYDQRDRGDVYNADGAPVSFQNIIYFVESADGWAADALTVGLTTNVFIPDTGYLVSADMEFNGINFAWRTASRGCSAANNNCFDVETVALHEAGHFIGFNHVQCTDAVMFPQGGSSDQVHDLSIHESTGLCAVYPPRDESVAVMDTGEICAYDNECPTGDVCAKPIGVGEDDYWGFCAKICSTTNDCPVAYVCAQQYDGDVKFCKPGVNDTGGAVDGGDGGGSVVDPTTGLSLDLCAPCDNGDQCAGGVCVNDGTGTGAICTQACSSAEGFGCPDSFECIATDQGWSVCWPLVPDECGQTSQDFTAGVNELCWQGGDLTVAEDDWYQPCGPDLVCFGFIPRCAGEQGITQDAACLNYCNASGVECAAGLTCCYGIDAYGDCIKAPLADQVHGGCFDIRQSGEPCVTAERAICDTNSSCFHFGDSTTSKCYRTCYENISTCPSVESCVTYSDYCGGQAALCCETGEFSASGACSPDSYTEVFEIGMECETNDDCESGLCLKVDGQAACSRECNPVTGTGCPADYDGDGIDDGIFECILVSNKPRCWPSEGPLDAPAGLLDPVDDGPPPPSGCCSAVGAPMSLIDLMMGLVWWLPMIFFWRRRR